MEKVGLIDKYIYPHYEALHTEDRNNLTDNIIETLNRWETIQEMKKSEGKSENKENCEYNG